MRKRRTGFTLIEILVVVGIIMLLITIAVVGFNQLNRTMATKATKGTFQNLQAMMDEFAAINGTGLIEGVNPTVLGLPFPIYNDAPMPPATNIAQRGAPTSISHQTDVTLFDGTGDDARYCADAIVDTQLVMGILMRMPHNLQAVQQLPQKQLLEQPYPAGGQGGLPASKLTPVAGGPLSPPVLVDAWHNPIIYVPAGGLTGVYLNGDKLNPHIVTAPDGHGFWASAGPDGDFTQGDDNLYSFQN